MRTRTALGLKNVHSLAFVLLSTRAVIGFLHSKPAPVLKKEQLVHEWRAEPKEVQVVSYGQPPQVHSPDRMLLPLEQVERLEATPEEVELTLYFQPQPQLVGEAVELPPNL